MTLACPKCTSAEVRKLSLIYNEGLSIINTVSQGSGMAVGSGGGMAFGSHSSHTTGRQQTALSKQAAPPNKRHWILWSSSAAIFGLITLGGLSHPSVGTFFTLGITALSVHFALAGKKYNAEVHPGLLARWEQSFMCNRCGEKFVPA
jgi:hypothetical protein